MSVTVTGSVRTTMSGRAATPGLPQMRRPKSNSILEKRRLIQVMSIWKEKEFGRDRAWRSNWSIPSRPASSGKPSARSMARKLGPGFFRLGQGVAIWHNARPGMETGLTAADLGAPDRHIPGPISAAVAPPDSPGIEITVHRFQPRNQIHGGRIGHAANRRRGMQRRSEQRARHVRIAQAPLDPGAQMPHRPGAGQTCALGQAERFAMGRKRVEYVFDQEPVFRASPWQSATIARPPVHRWPDPTAGALSPPTGAKRILLPCFAISSSGVAPTRARALPLRSGSGIWNAVTAGSPDSAANSASGAIGRSQPARKERARTTLRNPPSVRASACNRGKCLLNAVVKTARAPGQGPAHENVPTSGGRGSWPDRGTVCAMLRK